jgi:hypothetical protein
MVWLLKQVLVDNVQLRLLALVVQSCWRCGIDYGVHFGGETIVLLVTNYGAHIVLLLTCRHLLNKFSGHIIVFIIAS